MPQFATLARTAEPFPKRRTVSPTAAFRAELEQLLADDVPHGDLTTDALGIGSARGVMAFTARDSMVLALV